jgi:hypothetical protein
MPASLEAIAEALAIRGMRLGEHVKLLVGDVELLVLDAEALGVSGV